MKNAQWRYRQRAKTQMFSWAQGNSYHELINNECCPDFSCCFPNLFTSDVNKRWQLYREKYGDLS